jgi:hypothetical protein
MQEPSELADDEQLGGSARSSLSAGMPTDMADMELDAYTSGYEDPLQFASQRGSADGAKSEWGNPMMVGVGAGNPTVGDGGAMRAVTQGQAWV